MKKNLFMPSRIRFGSPRPPVMIFVTALLFLALTAWIQPVQAAPLAGTSIGNQASATYTDASAVPRTATSNTVSTIVAQVAGVTLDLTQSKTVAPGGTVYFSHTLKNTGNGNDTFGLTAADVAFGSGITYAGPIVMYADANGDGVADDSTVITSTGVLAAGATFKFIVAATVPGTYVDGNNDRILVTGTSVHTGTVTASNNDTITVSGKAIIVMNKSVSPGSGARGDTATYTLTYTNTGNATATNLRISDVLPTPNGMTYKTGDLARWSVSGATALTDALDAPDPNQTFGTYTINYDSETTPGTVSAIINKVDPGESRTLTFQVTIAATAAPGILNNSASFTYNDSSADVTSSTNTAPYTVLQTAAVVANGDSGASTDGNSEPITVASAVQGSTITFDAYVWNTGNGSDSFDITVANGGTNPAFPAGTSFGLYKADGVTPLIDTNTNSTPDTGALASAAGYHVVVKAILPAGATGGPYDATLTAKSKFDSTKTNPAILRLTSIIANTVDLTINSSRLVSTPAGIADATNPGTTGFGTNSGDANVAVIAGQSANPGASSTFVLKVNNTSTTSDNFDIAYSTTTSFSPAVVLPLGWTVVYKADGGGGACATTGAVISNTGLINNTGATAATQFNKTVCAIVSVPASETAGQRDIYFRVLSPASGATDILHTALTVNTVRAISVTNSQTGQIFPGGTKVYQMTVTNDGNVTEGVLDAVTAPNGSNGSRITLGNTDSKAGWTSVVYYDANGDGLINAGENIVSTLNFVSGASAGLDPKESVKLLVKVFAPNGAALGEIDTTTLTATPLGVINLVAAPDVSSATDTTTVITGQVTLTKEQALDAPCSNAAASTFTYKLGDITAAEGAVPGACVRYKVTAKNVGTLAINTLLVSDATPANTVYATGCGAGVPARSTTKGSFTSTPGNCSAGSIIANVGNLDPSEEATIYFGIRIDP